MEFPAFNMTFQKSSFLQTFTKSDMTNATMQKSSDRKLSVHADKDLLSVKGAQKSIERVNRMNQEKEILTWLKEKGLMLNEKNVRKAEMEIDMENERRRRETLRSERERSRSKSRRAHPNTHMQSKRSAS